MILTRPRVVRNDLDEIKRLAERLAKAYDGAYDFGLQGAGGGSDEIGYVSLGQAADPVGDIVADVRCDRAREATRRAAKATHEARRTLQAALASLARSIEDSDGS